MLLGKITSQQAVNIRNAPSKTGLIVGTAAPGGLYAVRDRGEWYEIVRGRFKGTYIFKEFVEAKLSSDEIGTVNAKSVRLRTGPSPTSAVKAMIDFGVVFPVEKFNNQWFRIKDGEYKGNFIAAPFVDLTTASVTTGEPTAASASTPSAPVTAEAGKKSKADKLIPLPKWDENKDLIFQQQVEKAFKAKEAKKKEGNESAVVMPVFSDTEKNQIGQIKTMIQPGQPLWLDRDSFLTLLKIMVADTWFKKEEVQAALTKAENNQDRWISLSAFENSGLTVKYDEKMLDLRVSVPAELRTTGTASLNPNRLGIDTETALAPSAFSTYFNFNANETFDSRNEAYKDKRSPLLLQIENGTNVMGWVLESSARYREIRSSEEDQRNFARDDVRLIKDFKESSLRFTAGDVTYPIQSFQVFRPMGGVQITKEFSLLPSKLTFPSGAYEIFLKRPSKVTVWINGQLQQQLDLPAGNQILKDFPFAAGMNDITFEITDDLGRQETVRYSYFSNTEMLAPGLHQFVYALGYPSSAPNGVDRIYDSQRTTLVASHRYGYSDYFSVGGNLESDKQISIAGLSGLWSTPIGYFKVEPAASFGPNLQTGGALGVRYLFSDRIGEKKLHRSFVLGLTARGESFTLFNETISGPKSRLYDATFGYSRSLSRDLSMNLGANYQINRKVVADSSDSYALTGGVSNKWESGLILSGNATHSRSEVGVEEISILFLLSWSFPKEKQSITAISNSQDQSSRLDWTYNPSRGADSASYSAHLGSQRGEQQYGGVVNYTGNRGRATIAHDVSIERVTTQTSSDSSTSGQAETSPTKSNHVTTFQGGMALVYADGRFALSRPVGNSFVIVTPVKNLKNTDILLNPESDNVYGASTDSFLGSAAIPELGAYNFTNLNLALKDPSRLAAIPQDHYNFMPTYKSGFAVEVGTDATVYLTAKLLKHDQTPLGSAGGQAVYLSDDKTPPVVIFTSKKGMLRSEGFKPGRYRLELDTDHYKPAEITIPETAQEEFDLGTVVFEEN